MMAQPSIEHMLGETSYLGDHCARQQQPELKPQVGQRRLQAGLWREMLLERMRHRVQDQAACPGLSEREEGADQRQRRHDDRAVLVGTPDQPEGAGDVAIGRASILQALAPGPSRLRFMSRRADSMWFRESDHATS